jgi:hypothetical protein
MIHFNGRFVQLIVLVEFYHFCLSLVCVGVINIYGKKHKEMSQREVVWRSYRHRDLAISMVERNKLSIEIQDHDVLDLVHTNPVSQRTPQSEFV